MELWGYFFLFLFIYSREESYWFVRRVFFWFSREEGCWWGLGCLLLYFYRIVEVKIVVWGRGKYFDSVYL